MCVCVCGYWLEEFVRLYGGECQCVCMVKTGECVCVCGSELNEDG